MTGPDYIVIGAMKCGTSTLAAQLGARSGFFMTTPKEPQYFSDDAVFARGPDWYADLFAAAAPDDLKGEASTHYTKLPDRPETVARAAAALPGHVRLIYMIRDPVARALSHYVHEWSQGVVPRGMGPDEALDRLPEMVSYGCYGMQVAPWLARFGHDRLHIDTLEAMQADPQGLMDRLGRFLDRPGLVWDEALGRDNVSAERLRRGPLDAWLLWSPMASRLRRTLVPRPVRKRIKAMRRMRERPAFSEASRARLEAAFAEDHGRLRALFPDRSDLDRCYPFLPAP
jgi:hypothetical protein